MKRASESLNSGSSAPTDRTELGAVAIVEPASEAKPGLSRRRFTRGGMAGTAVIGSLVSTPVLGNAGIYGCTISGKLSGNTSRNTPTTPCNQLGKSPGYWKNHSSWPSPLLAGHLPGTDCSFNTTTRIQGTFFDGFSPGSAPLSSAFRRKVYNGACKVYDASSSYFATATDKATMLQVLNTGGGLNDTAIAALGRATVASLLNAYQFGSNYPLTPARVVAMFNAVYNGGQYAIPNTSPQQYWSRDQVLAYFESLYGGT